MTEKKEDTKHTKRTKDTKEEKKKRENGLHQDCEAAIGRALILSFLRDLRFLRALRVLFQGR